MYTKLNSDADHVIVLQTKCRVAKEIEGLRGTRKLYSNTTEEICRFDLILGPTDEQRELLGDEAGKIETWADEQHKKIMKAFSANLEQMLVGGRPVIVGTKLSKEMADHPDFNKEAKVGEFSGVIAGARDAMDVLPHITEQQEVIHDTRERATRSPAEVSHAVRELALELLDSVAMRGDITDAEAFELYEAERQLYYILTRGMGYRAKVLEDASRKSAEQLFGQSKKGDRSKALKLISQRHR
ncbi:hypothetical protein MSNKSG1_00778 [Marinobacter santoriniensis NKSG1]|uniref:Uncharacterized protein n=1 Tax=Marinobacter santoriniensis NKSG1 TaxID=1288826 RepID=M7DHG4_9GAMM|nr:hypothetical protein [Marinobacter santoriniensis]EMP57112.1 hypothetical protein MSNKSG1_00778 [Marinobacter santoriniensis NKSG1]